MTTIIAGYDFRKFSSHSVASRSRWFDGSSSSSKSGSENSKEANATRIFHPPE